MPSWLCKIWRFVLNLFTKILAVISQVLKAVIDFVVDVVKAVASGVGSLLQSPLILLGLAAVAAYFLFGKGDDDGRDVSIYSRSDERS